MKNLVIHSRYGKARVVNVWKKLINPDEKITKTYAVTLVLLTDKGNILFNKDRTFRNMGHTKPLPRCFEDDLSKMKILVDGNPGETLQNLVDRRK